MSEQERRFEFSVERLKEIEDGFQHKLSAMGTFLPEISEFYGEIFDLLVFRDPAKPRNRRLFNLMKETRYKATKFVESFLQMVQRDIRPPASPEVDPSQLISLLETVEVSETQRLNILIAVGKFDNFFWFPFIEQFENTCQYAFQNLQLETEMAIGENSAFVKRLPASDDNYALFSSLANEIVIRMRRLKAWLNETEFDDEGVFFLKFKREFRTIASKAEQIASYCDVIASPNYAQFPAAILSRPTKIAAERLEAVLPLDKSLAEIEIVKVAEIEQKLRQKLEDLDDLFFECSAFYSKLFFLTIFRSPGKLKDKKILSRMQEMKDDANTMVGRFMKWLENIQTSRSPRETFVVTRAQAQKIETILENFDSLCWKPFLNFYKNSCQYAIESLQEEIRYFTASADNKLHNLATSNPNYRQFISLSAEIQGGFDELIGWFNETEIDDEAAFFYVFVNKFDYLAMRSREIIDFCELLPNPNRIGLQQSRRKSSTIPNSKWKTKIDKLFKIPERKDKKRRKDLRKVIRKEMALRDQMFQERQKREGKNE